MEELEMQTDLTEFMKHIRLGNKDISKYEDDDKGIMYHLNTIQLLTKVERLELSAEEYKKAKFECKIDKKLEYDIIEVDRPQSKYNITKKEEDRFTIVESKVKVRVVWNVSNALGIYKSFTNKVDALEYAEEINKNILPYFE
jgi:hypothetical protein